MTYLLRRDAAVKNRGKRKWGALNRLVHIGGGLAHAHHEARSRLHAVEGEGEEGQYCTQETLQLRYKLRRNPEVMHELHLWWETALRSMKHGGAGAVEPAGAVAPRDDYFSLCRCVYKALYEDYDRDEAQACAEEDWVNDCGGAMTLSRERFMDSWFELADLWTSDVKAQYAF